MTEQNKKLSRRDAIKLLGAAAGAAALANLPSKWSKPELVSGVLPAHAQTSACAGDAASFTINANAGFVTNYEVWLNGSLVIGSVSLSPGQSYSGNYPCGSGCLEIFAFSQLPGPVPTVDLTTFSSGTTTIPFTGIGPALPPFTVDILVDLSTGQYSTTRSQTVGSCGWVTV